MSPSLLPRLSCLPKLMAPFTCQSFIHLLSNQPIELDQVLSLVLDKQKIGLYRVLSLVLNKLQLSPRRHHIAYPQPFLYPIASAPNIAGCAYHKIDMSTLRKESRETQHRHSFCARLPKCFACTLSRSPGSKLLSLPPGHGRA